MPPSRQYPHVDDIADWHAQQTIRLLWDQVFDLEAGVQAVERSVGDLASQVDAHEDAVTFASRTADEALATAVQTAGEAPAAEGISTIPDYLSIVQMVLSTKFVSPIVPIAQADAGKAQLTRAAAWEIYNTVDNNMRLLQKTSGTQVNNRSVDIILQGTDGSFADCATDQDNPSDPTTKIVAASWGRKAPDSNTSDTSRWIVPTATIAAESGPMTPV